jgi:putative restriction endonuclease
MAIGDLPGVLPGQVFPSRADLAAAGVHRATQAGITGVAGEGAESIVLLGGYPDDHDEGDVIVYTGHGGRDSASGRQIADQTFTRQNQALVTSSLNGLPVRVTRGAGHRSPHSPAAGYRYDGLYWVDSYWQEPGRDGYLICRFRLVKSPEDRGDVSQSSLSNEGPSGPALRSTSTIARIVRDTELGRRVKALYGHQCQVCRTVLECQGGHYAEAAHVRPLGRPHDGPDELSNLLCLCPNHHVLFDNGGFSIADDLSLLGTPGSLALHPRHTVKPEHLAYHRHIWGRGT